MKHVHNTSKGQAVITVIFIAVIGMFIATGAIFTVANALEAVSSEELGAAAFQAAESGIENSVLRLMRDPTYVGETIEIDEKSTVVVSVTSDSGITIQSIGTVGIVSRKIIAHAHYDNLVLIVDSWGENP